MAALTAVTSFDLGLGGGPLSIHPSIPEFLPVGRAESEVVGLLGRHLTLPETSGKASWRKGLRLGTVGPRKGLKLGLVLGM